MPTRARVAVLASGGGTNLQALIDRFNADPPSPARVELVLASRAGIGAIDRARRAGIDSAVLSARELEPAELGARMLHALDAHGIEIVVLAGYLQLVPLAVVERYHGRMINVHPALLPAFGGHGMYGMRVHRAVLESGARISGATVHLVDARYDEGAILAQWPVPVAADDTAETLAARVLRVEHVLLPVAVEALAVRISAGEGAPVGPAAGQGGADALRSIHPPAGFELVGREAPSPEAVRRMLRLP